VALADTPARSAGLLSRAPSPALVLGGIASVQLGAAIATKLFAHVGPAGAVLLRLIAATIVLLAIWRPRLRGRSQHELMLAAGFGVVLGVMNLCFYAAIDRIPLGIAVTIQFVGPLTIAVIGSRRAIDLAWVGLAAAGIVALMNGDPHGLNGVGVAFALLAGALWGTYILVNARVGRTFEGATGLALAMTVACVVALPLGIAQGGTALLKPRSLALGGAVGILSSAIPYTFEMEALRRIATSVFGVLMSLEPAVAALAGFVVLGQSLSGREAVGIGLVVAASIGASRRARETAIDV
jgi:inner membrane transporter RhtA